jgi:hypothetical protein
VQKSAFPAENIMVKRLLICLIILFNYKQNILEIYSPALKFAPQVDLPNTSKVYFELANKGGF